MIEAENYKMYLVCRNLEGEVKESGHYRFWPGFLTYNGLPITEVVANHRLDPGMKTLESGEEVPKKPWMVVSESVTKDERVALEEQGLEPEVFGWATMDNAVVKGEEKGTAKIVQANIYGLSFPMAGWVNKKTVQDKEGNDLDVETLCLSFSASDLDFWESKVENPYILDDKDVSAKDWEINCQELAKDYPGFQTFVSKYFPSSRTANASKRRDLLSKFKKKDGSKTKAKNRF